MIKVAIVAGKVVDKLVSVLDKREYSVEFKYETIDQLWEDILLRGNSAFVDIDKIVVIANGFLKESDMPHEEQILNLQSIMAMENLRSTLYFIIKDADLYQKVKDNSDDLIVFRNFNMFMFKEVNTRNFEDVVKGSYDSRGLFHPDFLRKNEIDAAMNRADEEDEEEEVIEEPVQREKLDEYVDTDENKKDIKKMEIESRREQRKKEIEEQRKKKKEEAEARRRSKKNDSGGGGGWFKRKEPKKAPAPKRSKGIVDLYRGVVAVTGDRQSGVSTTVANMAEIYAKNGHSVLIIDLDVKRRSQTIIFPSFKEAIQMENRVAHGLLVSLVNPKNLDAVHSVVSDNIAVLSISDDVEREITKFANRPFEQIFSAANMVNLLSFSKSLFDVVLLDMPLESLKKIGACLSYVDKVVMCIPNTTYHLDNLLEIEIEELLLKNDLIAHTLMSKSKILLTKYNDKSLFAGKEMTENIIIDLLGSLEESFYHLDVLGRVPFTDDYEKQFDRGKKIVTFDSDYRDYFEDFMQNI